MTRLVAGVTLLAMLLPAGASPRVSVYDLKVLPSERVVRTDPQTGARLEFISTSKDRDNNLYFHQRSFVPDDSLALFTRNGALMGYVCATGELVRISTPSGGVGLAVVAKTRSSVYCARGKDILELALQVKTAGARGPSRVTCTERLITTLDDRYAPQTFLSESCDGRSLAMGTTLPDGQKSIIGIDVRSGRVRDITIVPAKDYAVHVQYSHTDPHVLSYAGIRNRLMLVDTRTGARRPMYRERPGELVTHESWWVKDQMVFCGGHRKEESHVKVLDVHTGVVRIIGAGAWWPEGTPREVSKWNWWHACADDAGRYVVADNWHGDIVAFDAQTTRAIPITHGHRKYGGAGFGQSDHPHVGWDRSGKRVIFTSTINGTPDVVVATIPE